VTEKKENGGGRRPGKGGEVFIGFFGIKMHKVVTF
jgi:hypothetical protein